MIKFIVFTCVTPKTYIQSFNHIYELVGCVAFLYVHILYELQATCFGEVSLILLTHFEMVHPKQKAKGR